MNSVYTPITFGLPGGHASCPDPERRDSHYEPCTLPHMALSAIGLWHARTGFGMPQQDLLQALIVDHSPGRIATILDSLVWSGTLRVEHACYWLAGAVAEQRTPRGPRQAPPTPPYLLSLPWRSGKLRTLHLRSQRDHTRTCCGYGMSTGYDELSEAPTEPYRQCGHCAMAGSKAIKPFPKMPALGER